MASKKREPWRSNERHYCRYCNAWMGSDRQSIMIHENGKKHREAVENSLQQRRLDRLQQEREQDDLAKSMQAMEKAAVAAHAVDVASGAFCRESGPSAIDRTQVGKVGKPALPPDTSTTVIESIAPTVAPGIPKKQVELGVTSTARTSELNSWQSRKKKREAASSQSDANCVPGHQQQDSTRKISVAKRELGPDEGYYTVGKNTYLEGCVYAPIIEEDMPAQLWTGVSSASDAEKQGEQNQMLWRTCLVAKVNPAASDLDSSEITFNIAYLKNPGDEDETMERSVDAKRIRLVIGTDGSIPSSIEEARLALLGGEEITMNEESAAAIDENTGLTSWGTVSVRKVTVNQELKEERARIREKKREEAEKERQKEREAEARKMEEAKHSNADDSALGAYDVWSSGKGGYKGVDINKEMKLDVADTAKVLSKGMGPVAFKKRGHGESGGSSVFRRAKKKKNIRRTSADDD